MLVYSEDVKHSETGFHQFINSSLVSCLVNDFQGEQLIGSHEVMGSPADIFLIIGSACEESRPEAVFVVGVGEHVVVPGGPLDVLLLQLVDVVGGSGVLEGHVGVVGVHVVHQPVQRLEIHMRVLVVEVTSKYY